MAVMPFKLYTSFEIRRRALKARPRSNNGGQVSPPRHKAGAIADRLEQKVATTALRGTGRASPPLVIAVHDNDASDSQELPFERGNILAVLKVIDADWLMCRLDGKIGLVPSNYTRPAPSYAKMNRTRVGTVPAAPTRRSFKAAAEPVATEEVTSNVADETLIVAVNLGAASDTGHSVQHDAGSRTTRDEDARTVSENTNATGGDEDMSVEELAMLAELEAKAATSNS